MITRITILFIYASLSFAELSPGARQIARANSDIALSNDVFSNSVKGKDGWWRIKGMEDIIPMMFSIKAKM
jgi:hypothetical protein